jgi:sporulation protein YlmC with PRC-barrel domain
MATYDTGSSANLRAGEAQAEHVRETHELISAEKVIGTSVYNANGDDLGSIHDLMIDKRGGRVAYAVMSFGGFLGIGEKYHPLPWHVLTYDEDKGGYNVGLSADQLRNAPTYSEAEMSRFGADADDQRVNQ